MDLNIEDLTEGRLVIKSLDESSLSYVVKEGSPPAKGTPVTVKRNNQVVLIGEVVSIQRNTEGGRTDVNVMVVDYWHRLNNTTFLAPMNNNLGLRTKLTTGDIQGVSPAPKYYLRMILTKVLDRAKEIGIPIDYQIDQLDNSQIPEMQFTNTSYGDLIRKILKWQPNAVSVWNYTGIKPKLIICPSLSYAALNTSTMEIPSISLKPRYDLVPPAVGFIANMAVGGQVTRPISAYPSVDLLNNPYAILSEIDVPAYTQLDDNPEKPIRNDGSALGDAFPRMRVKGERLPYDHSTAKTWWLKKEPRLKKHPMNLATSVKFKFENLDVDADLQDSNYDPTLNPQNTARPYYMLVEGELSPECKTIKWNKVRFTCRFELDVNFKIPDDCKDMVTTRSEGGNWVFALAVEMIVINVNRHAYKIDGEGTDVPLDDKGEYNEPDPDVSYAGIPTGKLALYADLAKQIYNATRITPYDGTIQINSALTSNFVGSQLKLTSTDPNHAEYANMRSTCHTLETDLRTGYSTLSLGAAPMLGLDDLKTLQEMYSEMMRQVNEANTLRNNGTSGWRPNKKDKPKAPTISPLFTKVNVSTGDFSRYSFKVTEITNDDGTTKGYTIDPGYVYFQGSQIAYMNQGSVGNWSACYLNLSFYDGKLTSAAYSEYAGQMKPFQAQQDENDKENYYSILIFDTNRGFMQCQMGHVWLQTHLGTFYPFGPMDFVTFMTSGPTF